MTGINEIVLDTMEVSPLSAGYAMRWKPAFSLLFTPVLLAGCASDWTRPDTSREQMSRDLDACREWAMDEFPVVSSRTLPSYQSQSSVGCSGGDCRARPGSTFSEPVRDLNREGREQAVIACMESRSYSRP